MRIYLSAYRLGPHAEALHLSGGKALISFNALDEFDQRLLTWDREADDLRTLGYRSEELDLREYWGKNPETLADRLAAFDLLWVVGGNSFVLARAATAAGLATAFIRSPSITYAGYSAGACLTSIDLAGIDLMDDPSTLPAGYLEAMPAQTLNLTGTRVVPHAGSAEATAAAGHLRGRGHEFVELADGEDWLIL